ncbi:MAG: large-conductance mechanosensitive channel [Candidatus Phytoplasma cynodontis]|uniref:large conductance mechanosensitive channel protein MscL n=1 Tax='Cynodon dactylon' phytoplasma TaxID=295320 RepID=UPI001265D5EB|nr:large conductance mechanosensitive channel protein MscL ['Cynodon dactylon' phytoplasma]KAB8122030.1 large conductance mechanosensitive channel protein MscL ['Cynodon dactylon' phytoplasma]WIA07553.1 MAG: large-conductance mechanosensitive channel [Candidatus Phytoplasma cynodontis]
MKLDLKKVKSFRDGFKNFISKGDVIKLSVAFIMGQLFTKVVSSLSTDIIMPPLTFIFSRTKDLSSLKFQLGSDIYINYGIFLQNVFEFLLVSFFLYIILVYFFKKVEQKDDNKVAAVNTQPNLNKNLEILEQQQIDILKDIKEVLSQK